MSLLMKVLTKEGSPYYNYLSRVGIGVIIYVSQSYSAIPKNLRRQAKAVFVWYPKTEPNLNVIHDENDVLTDDELVVVRGLLRKSKHAFLYI